MSYQSQVCDAFDSVVTDLRLVCPQKQEETLEVVQASIVELNSTYRPLLDGYYTKEYSKEVYCCIREDRENAVSNLECAVKTLQQYVYSTHDERNVKDFVRQAICWIEKAQAVLCEPDSCSSSSSCTVCSSSCSTGCESTWKSVLYPIDTCSLLNYTLSDSCTSYDDSCGSDKDNCKTSWSLISVSSFDYSSDSSSSSDC